jgi:hypothetical protein
VHLLNAWYEAPASALRRAIHCAAEREHWHAAALLVYRIGQQDPAAVEELMEAMPAAWPAYEDVMMASKLEQEEAAMQRRQQQQAELQRALQYKILALEAECKRQGV